MESNELYKSQKPITIHRTDEELHQPNAPVVSLADKEQLTGGRNIVRTSESKLRLFNQKLQEAAATEQVNGAHIGARQRITLEESVTEDYVSVTSGYSIASLEHDLKTKWKYQRFNNSDSQAMKDLKAALAEVTGHLSDQNSFESHEEIREACAEMAGRYKALIATCEAYLEKSQSPLTIAGKARKNMAQRLLQASMAEMEMLEDSAINCFDEARILDSTKASVDMTWDRILHHGRLRKLNSDKDRYQIDNKKQEENTAILRYQRQNKREMITYANSEEQLKGCRRVVAMSSLAQKLGLGRLAGGEEMSTRMTTMVVGEKVITGVVTTDITKKNYSEYERELAHDQVKRPGKDILPERKVTYGAEYLKDILALPFLDYLCGINRQSVDEFGIDKKEVPGGLVMGRIQTDCHKLAKSGFGQSFAEFTASEDTWMDAKLARKIKGLDEATLLNMLTGVLDKEERAAAVLRLRSLKAWIAARESEGGTIFKSDADYTALVNDPRTLSAYARSQAGKTHKFLDENVASKDQSRDLSVKETGMLRPLADLAKEIGEPVGKNADELKKTLEGIEEEINKFNTYRSETVDFSESEDDFLKEIEAEFDPILKVREKCTEYLHKSHDPKDITNRLAVSNLFQSSLHQEKVYTAHVFAMRRWAQRVLEKGTDRSFDYTFDDLFKEAIYIGQKTDKATEFSVSDMYDGVVFEEKELCLRTNTEPLTDLYNRLSAELEDKEKSGDENGVLIASAFESLGYVIEEQQKKVDGGLDAFLRTIAKLRYSCDSYLEKLNTKKTKGVFTETGRTRKQIAKAILRTIDDEYGFFLNYDDVRLAKLKPTTLDYLKESCMLDGIKEPTIGDICLASKKELLVRQEKEILSGEAEKKAQAKRERKSKKEREREEAARLREQLRRPAQSFVEHDTLEMESYLSKLGRVAEIRSYVSGKIDTPVRKDKMTKKEARRYYESLYKLEIKKILKIKDSPLFSEYQADEFRKKLKTDKTQAYKDLHNTLVGKYNEISDVLQEAQRPLQGYFNTEPDDVKKIKTVNNELFWEFYAFKKGPWITMDPDNKEELRPTDAKMDYERFYDYVRMLVESGKPLEQITYTDLTNILKMDRAYRSPFVVEKQDIGSDLAALETALTNRLGKKFIASEESEFLAVQGGLGALLEAKGKQDKDTLALLYDDMAQKCERYERKHPGGTSKKMLLVQRTRLVCTYERMRLGL